jgi:hypothetical protein
MKYIKYFSPINERMGICKEVQELSQFIYKELKDKSEFVIETEKDSPYPFNTLDRLVISLDDNMFDKGEISWQKDDDIFYPMIKLNPMYKKTLHGTILHEVNHLYQDAIKLDKKMTNYEKLKKECEGNKAEEIDRKMEEFKKRNSLKSYNSFMNSLDILKLIKDEIYDTINGREKELLSNVINNIYYCSPDEMSSHIYNFYSDPNEIKNYENILENNFIEDLIKDKILINKIYEATKSISFYIRLKRTHINTFDFLSTNNFLKCKNELQLIKEFEKINKMCLENAKSFILKCHKLTTRPNLVAKKRKYDFLTINI